MSFQCEKRKRLALAYESMGATIERDDSESALDWACVVGIRKGTVRNCSKEQIEGKQVDPKSI